jgi:hypothetical protein
MKRHFLIAPLLGAVVFAATPMPARAGEKPLVSDVVAASTSESAVPANETPSETPTPGNANGANRASSTETVELRGEVDRLRTLVERQEKALSELQQRLDRLAPAPTAAPGTTQAASTVATAPAPSAEAAPAAAAQDDAIKKQLDELTRRWGKLRLSGDVQLRAESFFNQGFDGPELKPRNRFRLRARVQLASEITKNFDWGIRVATGSFANPISLQQSFTDYYTRKPFALDRAFVRFTSKTDPVDVELIGGKFEPTWKRTPFTLDPDLQPEGFAQSLRFAVGNDSPLRAVKVTAFELPFRERAVGADGALFGGQVLTEWKWSDNWSTTLSGTFHDFEQVDLIPPVVGALPTLVNGGLDYATTNTVFINPFTNLAEYRSEFRVIDAIAEIKYTGLSEKLPLTITVNYLHNTSAFNNQKDGGLLQADLGRRQEKGDWALEYWFWKAEREVFPSVFMDSEMQIQTNSLTHAIKGSYLVHKQVQLDFRYLAHRRLATLAVNNRWQNHLQFDVNYRF